MNIRFSKEFLSNYEEIDLAPFSMDFLLIKNLRIDQDLLEKVELAKNEALLRIESHQTQIRNNIAIFKEYFSFKGFDFPLEKQLDNIIKKGFRKINPIIDLLLVAELSTGVLAGIQDLSKIEGDLDVDISSGNDSFLSMQSKEIKCNKGELVLRDTKTIIASMTQGPDNKTMITSNSKHLILFTFCIPNISTKSSADAVSIFVKHLENHSTIEQMTLRN